jgi:hypothetical protein
LACPARRSFGPGLIFLVLFASRQKEQKELRILSISFTFFLLGVQKKERNLPAACLSADRAGREKHTANDEPPLAEAMIKF